MEVEGEEGGIPTALDSDLETILETDQESNYMTTARTQQKVAQQKKNADHRLAAPSQTSGKHPNPLYSSLNSLDGSSFILND